MGAFSLAARVINPVNICHPFQTSTRRCRGPSTTHTWLVSTPHWRQITQL